MTDSRESPLLIHNQATRRRRSFRDENVRYRFLKWIALSISALFVVNINLSVSRSMPINKFVLRSRLNIIMCNVKVLLQKWTNSMTKLVTNILKNFANFNQHSIVKLITLLLWWNSLSRQTKQNVSLCTDNEEYARLFLFLLPRNWFQRPDIDINVINHSLLPSLQGFFSNSQVQKTITRNQFTLQRCH